MLRGKYPFSPDEKCRCIQNPSPLVSAARGPVRAQLVVMFWLVSYLRAFFIALPPTPPAAALPRRHPGRLLAAAPGRLAHTPRAAARTRALPPLPAWAAPPAAEAAVTGWQVASQPASVR